MSNDPDYEATQRQRRAKRDAAHAKRPVFHVHVLIDRIRAIARGKGWAIGVHGSLERDIDLIGVPWVADACSVADLYLAISAESGWSERGNHSVRAHGRHTFILLAPDAQMQRGPDGQQTHPKGHWIPPAVDLSLVDPRNVGPVTDAMVAAGLREQEQAEIDLSDFACKENAAIAMERIIAAALKVRA